MLPILSAMWRGFTLSRCLIVLAIIFVSLGNAFSAGYDFDKIFENNDNAKTAPVTTKMNDLVDGAARQSENFDEQNRRTKQKVVELVNEAMTKASAAPSVPSSGSGASGRSAEVKSVNAGSVPAPPQQAGYQTVKYFPLENKGYTQIIAEIKCNNGRKGYVYYDPRESYYKYSAGGAMNWGDLRLANGNNQDKVAMEACRN